MNISRFPSPDFTIDLTHIDFSLASLHFVRLTHLICNHHETVAILLYLPLLLKPFSSSIPPHTTSTPDNNYCYNTETMANKATTTPTNAVGLSVREVDILCAMCQSFKSKPDVSTTTPSQSPSQTTPTVANHLRTDRHEEFRSPHLLHPEERLKHPRQAPQKDQRHRPRRTRDRQEEGERTQAQGSQSWYVILCICLRKLCCF